ncbi:MAG: tetratricopeptide repeat protein [Chloroflexi bacterium]|nr:tetratricopeptide repeat protein [Chloroflexota bacterium]
MAFQSAAALSQRESHRDTYVKTITLNLLGDPSAPAANVDESPNLVQLLPPATLLVGRYRIIEALKSGGMGAIYLAHDEHQGNLPCAIKEMLDRFTDEDEREAGRAWFKREATTLASLQHALIPLIYDYFIDRGRYYLALEYIDGVNLEDLLARDGRPGLPERMVLTLGAAICDVLTYLHSQTPPLIFRDLKPANIMITRRGDVRLVDFGIARSFSALRSASMVGTPGYAPIEQYHGLADAQSDLYSLGATMHHLLTGSDPRSAPPFTHKPVRMLVPDISRATERLLEGALHKEAANRGPRIEEFGRQLRRIDSDLAQGLVPAIIDTVAIHAPDVRMPPTHMSIARGTMDFGTKNRGALHTLNFPVSNDGNVELRVVMRANVPWLHTPDGQLRVPPGSLVQVPLNVDCRALPIGQHKARIELAGNGGVESVPVEVRVTYWWFNGAGVLMVAGIGMAGVLAILVHLLIHFK